MKPHIFKRYGWWYCRTCMGWGVGDSPARAYENWCWVTGR